MKHHCAVLIRRVVVGDDDETKRGIPVPALERSRMMKALAVHADIQ